MSIIKFIVLVAVVIVIGGAAYIWKTTDWQEPLPKSALLVHTYISSPGFTTPEAVLEFEKNKKECLGYSRLLNEEAMAADAPGLSLCIGILR
jgi:hypothetical protein